MLDLIRGGAPALAVVTGKGGRDIAEADAMGHGGQRFKGKSLDRHGSMGPG